MPTPHRSANRSFDDPRTRRSVWARCWFVLAAFAVLASACGNGSDDDAAQPEEADPTTDQSAEDDAGGADPELIDVSEITFPDGVTVPSQQNAIGFTGDGTRIYSNVEVEGAEGRHIGTIALDGSDFRCLTCNDLASVDLDLRQPALHEDDRRFAVRNGSEDQRHAIVECTPNVLDCETAEIVPVEIPVGPIAILRNAQLRIAPDGEHVLFTKVRADGVLAPHFGDLVRGADGYTVENLRVLAGFRSNIEETADGLVLAQGNWGEAKGFADGGASVVYYTTLDSLNFDSVKLDLATGEITRLTAHPEYDEDGDVSPDGERFVTASYRNYSRMGAFSLVPRPPVVDAALRAPFVLLRNQNERRFFDLFVIPVGRAEDEVELAIQVKGTGPNDPDTNSRGTSRWSPDGTKLVYVEETADSLGIVRVLVATFAGQEPTDPVPIVPSPDPTWAPLLSDVKLTAESVSGTLDGSDSGSARVDYELVSEAGGAQADIRVEYVDYSEDGCSFLNGTETAVVEGLDYVWTADLEVTGCHEGSLTANVSGVILPASVSGTVAAEYDGATVTEVPQP